MGTTFARCVALIMAISASIAVGCGSDDPGQSAGEAFDFDSGDLCTRVTVEEMAAIVIDAYEASGTELPAFGSSATAITQPRVLEPTGDYSLPGCEWLLSERIWVWVVDGRDVLEDARRTTDRRTTARPLDAIGFEPMVSDPLLDDEVEWSRGGFGTSWFYVEARDGLIAFSHSGPEGGASGEDFTQEFRIVNQTLDRMGWITADAR